MSPSLQSRVRTLLDQHNLVANHRLGQNFLIDEELLFRIAQSVPLEPGDAILEIGAGIGTFTEQLMARSEQVFAVEYDAGFARILQERFTGDHRVTVIHQEAVRFLREERKQLNQLADLRFRVAANLPFQVSTPVLLELLIWEPAIPSVTIMVQEEFAERVRAPAGSRQRSGLGVLIQYRYHPKILVRVSPSSFWPVPRVNSAVLQLTLPAHHESEFHPPFGAALFRRVVRAAFSQRRKNLTNTLRSDNAVASLGRAGLIRLLQSLEIDPNRRAESLTVEEFVRLTTALFEAGVN